MQGVTKEVMRRTAENGVDHGYGELARRTSMENCHGELLWAMGMDNQHDNCHGG